MTRPPWPGKILIVVAVVAAAVVVAAVAAVVGVAAVVVDVVAAVKTGQWYLDPAPLAESDLWRGQRCPPFRTCSLGQDNLLPGILPSAHLTFCRSLFFGPP